MDLQYEKKLIEFDAECALKECEKRAEDRDLELDYVISEFLKAFRRLAKAVQQEGEEESNVHKAD